MNKLGISILIIMLFISGCAEQKLLEKIGLITLVGYDLNEEGKVVTTAVIRQVDPEFQSMVTTSTAVNDSSLGALTEINRKTTKKLMPGQMRIVLFGNNLATDGIKHFLNTLSKNSSTSSGILLSMTTGSTRDLLEYSYKDSNDVGQEIYKLIEQNVDSEQVTSSTLHEVTKDYYSIGRDIMMPIIVRKGEVIEVSGVALFNQDKVVGQLPANDSFYLMLNREKFKSGKFETSIPKGIFPSDIANSSASVPVVLDTISSKKKLKLTNKKELEFDLHIKLNGRILELDAEVDFDNPKEVEKLEKAISQSLVEGLTSILEYCQDIHSDVFGLGEQYRSQVRKSNLTDESWHNMYPSAKVNIKVDFNIIRSGVFE